MFGKKVFSVKNESLYENLDSFSVVFRVEFSFCLFEYQFKGFFLMIRPDLKMQHALKWITFAVAGELWQSLSQCEKL